MVVSSNHDTDRPRKRRRLNQVEALRDTIGGGRILGPSERRRRPIFRGISHAPVDSHAEGPTKEEIDTSAQESTSVETSNGEEKPINIEAPTGLEAPTKTDIPSYKQEDSRPPATVNGSSACICYTLADLPQIKDCPATSHIIRQITQWRFGLGSSPWMCIESEHSIVRELAPFLSAVAFSQLGTIIIRRDILQPLDMSLGLLQIRANAQAEATIDVRTRYDKKSCVVQAGLRILQEAQNLNLGFEFFSIDMDSSGEVCYREELYICRTVEVRVSKTRGPSEKTAEDRERVFQELRGIVFDSREDDIPGAEGLYTWLMSKGADMIA